MALIKHASARELAREAIVLDLGDLARQGEKLRSRSKADAEAIVAQAKAERERLLAGAREEGQREGFARGLEEGRRQGLEQGRAEAMAAAQASLESLSASWASALDAFGSDRETMLQEARREVLRLALRIAEKVTKRAIRVEHGVAVDQVAAVLALVSSPTRLTIAVHPEDLPLVQEALPSLCERFAASSQVEIITDGQLPPGSCVARRAGGGVVDASIDVQLERIAEALLPGDSEEPRGRDEPEGAA